MLTVTVTDNDYKRLLNTFIPNLFFIYIFQTIDIGDIAMSNKNKELMITDRVKELIKYKGIQVNNDLGAECKLLF